MINRNVPKYAASSVIDLPDRQWPSQIIENSPQWCSVDLRDGNQALPNPLNPEQKLEYFKLLYQIGFKHIEVAFPSASQDDFDFTRCLIEQKHIPDDVFIMVLTQCREEQIDRTFQSIKGIPRGIFHAYYASSDLHLKHVFGLSRKEFIKKTVKSVQQIRQLTNKMPNSDIRFEFSPEEFTDTDFSFALELCEVVLETWGKATKEKPLIFNLPATVERRPPNQYADMIEKFCKNFSKPDRIIISAHAHNDQGMAIAATEMAILAGAKRVEGTLFGHGERTGNVDIVTLANNLYFRNIDTQLDFSNLPEISTTVERLTGMPIYYRQPYAGEYAFTAFSGSHQDAIRKGMNKLKEVSTNFGIGWKVPYLHVDPTDLGRKYEDLIRINTQSGKGGAAWVLEQEFGLKPPKKMHPEIGSAAQRYATSVGREITADELYKVFQDEFVKPYGAFELIGYWPRPDKNDPTLIHGELKIKISGQEKDIIADGNGPISAFVQGINQIGVKNFTVEDYHEQAVGNGADARAVAYVPLKFDSGETFYGVGSDTNIDQAAVHAIIAALNRNTKISS
ncbi:2-isopropylmalate synthase [Spirochaetota bacterium]